MATIFNISADAAHDMALALIAKLDAGAGPAQFHFYDGTILPTPGTAITTQVRLGTLTCSDPSAADSDGTITFDSITQDSGADATGTASWVLITNGAGTPVAVGNVTNAAGDGFVKLNTTSVVAGGPIQITSAVIVVG
nr:hypothetical protein [uncultured Acidovorax sp.]